MKKDFSEGLSRAATQAPASKYFNNPIASDTSSPAPGKGTEAGQAPAVEQSPAMAFITPQEQAPAGPGREFKSKRLQVLLKPSIYERLKARAAREYTSVNNVINKILGENA